MGYGLVGMIILMVVIMYSSIPDKIKSYFGANLKYLQIAVSLLVLVVLAAGSHGVLLPVTLVLFAVTYVLTKHYNIKFFEKKNDSL
jgi:hypothetical protein